MKRIFNSKSTVGVSFLAVLMLLCIILTSGCATSSVERVSTKAWFKEMNENALNSDVCSIYTRQFLRRHALEEKIEKDPLGTLKKMDSELCKRADRNMLFTMAELSYQQGKQAKPGSEEARMYFFSSVRYAFAALFDKKIGPQFNEFDPRFQLVADIYNRSLIGAIENRDTDWISKLEQHLQVPLLRGSMVCEEVKGNLVNLQQIDHSTIVYNFRVNNLRNHFSRAGLGIPMVATRDPQELNVEVDDPSAIIKEMTVIPCTMLLLFEGSICDVDSTHPVTCDLHIYDPVTTPEVEIAQKKVPLKTDLSVPIALAFEDESNLGGITGMYRKLHGDTIAEKRGLYFMRPYEKGKIPVVFVHGLLSSPSTWIQLVNDFLSDSELTKQFQFWLFFYPTSDPILFSGSELREDLVAVQKKYDPYSIDSAFNKMVVVGHSMGGLLTQLQITDSNGDYLKRYEEKIDASLLTEQEKTRLRKLDYFEPLPFISRVMFLSTPHRGAKMAKNFIGKIGDLAILFPRYFVQEVGGLAEKAGITTEHIPTGIDNLQEDCPFIITLNSKQIDPRIPYHSIIGNKDEAGVAGGSDGVVDYESSHIDGAVSELIVHSTHSVQAVPETPIEVRRILMQHLDENNIPR